MNKEGLEFVIVRTAEAGVHMGYLLEEKQAIQGGYPVTLIETRRIWEWQGANSLSELGALGSSKPDDCRFALTLPKNKMIAIEIISVTPQAKANLEAVPMWKFKK